MENKEKTIIFNKGEVKLNLGKDFTPKAKRSIFGRESLNIYFGDWPEPKIYGPFDPEKTISIESSGDKYDGIIVISKSDNEGKVIFTHYYSSANRNGMLQCKKSFEVDSVTKCERPCLYLLEENGKTRIYVPIDTMLLPKYFEKVYTDSKKLADMCSVRVEEIIRSEVNPEVYDIITYGFDPFDKMITTNILSELQNRTINMENAAEELGKKYDRFANTISESDDFIIEEEIKKYLDLVAFYTQREELTQEEVIKKIGTRR